MNHGIRTRLAAHQYLKRTGRPNLKPIPLTDPRPELGNGVRARIVGDGPRPAVWVGGEKFQKLIRIG